MEVFTVLVVLKSFAGRGHFVFTLRGIPKIGESDTFSLIKRFFN